MDFAAREFEPAEFANRESGRKRGRGGRRISGWSSGFATAVMQNLRRASIRTRTVVPKAEQRQSVHPLRAWQGGAEKGLVSRKAKCYIGFARIENNCFLG